MSAEASSLDLLTFHLVFYLVLKPLKILAPFFSCPMSNEQMDRKSRFQALLRSGELSIFFITGFASDVLDALFDVQARVGNNPQGGTMFDVELMMKSSLPYRPLLGARLQGAFFAPPTGRLQIPAKLKLPAASSETIDSELAWFGEQGLITEAAEPWFSNMIVDAENRNEIQVARHDLMVAQNSSEHFPADVELSLRVATINEATMLSG